MKQCLRAFISTLSLECLNMPIITHSHQAIAVSSTKRPHSSRLVSPINRVKAQTDTSRPINPLSLEGEGDFMSPVFNALSHVPGSFLLPFPPSRFFFSTALNMVCVYWRLSGSSLQEKHRVTSLSTQQAGSGQSKHIHSHLRRRRWRLSRS